MKQVTQQKYPRSNTTSIDLTGVARWEQTMYSVSTTDKNWIEEINSLNKVMEQ